jgi:hypothetical protein
LCDVIGVVAESMVRWLMPGIGRGLQRLNGVYGGKSKRWWTRERGGNGGRRGTNGILGCKFR